MKRALCGTFIAAACATALAQTQPSSRPATTPATRAASTAPKNLDTMLQNLITLDATNARLAEFTDSLRKITQTNIVVNWNALAAAGITRDTPVTIHVREVSFEAAIHALMEMLPGDKSGGINFDVGDNILEITTNAQLALAPEFRLRDIGHAVSYSLSTAVAAPDEREQNGRTLQQVLAAEMRRAGEPPDARHALTVKDGALAVSVSDRGLAVIDRAVADFNQPVKLGQLAAGTQLTAPAKTAAAALKAAGVTADDYHLIALHPEEYAGKLNFALLPGTPDEIKKDTAHMEGTISDGGILLVGPREAIRSRTLMAVYDLRDVIKKIAAKNKLKPAPTPDEIESAVMQILRTTLKPDGDGTWANAEELAKDPHASALIPVYGGMLVVFATPGTHRAVAGALQDMAK